jgi:hypothetical protein
MSASIGDTTKKKRGRKVTTGKGVATMVRLHQPILGALDSFIAASDNREMSRAEAIRRVLAEALGKPADAGSIATEDT